MTDEPTKPRLSRRKLQELVLYISRRCRGDRHFGMTKLHKILWLSDFRHFSLTGRSITGSKYVHKQFGPVSANLDPVVRQMEDSQELEIKHIQFGNYTQKRPIALRRASMTHLESFAIANVEDVISEVWHMSATDLSHMSHRHPGWQLTSEGEEIGYEFAAIPFVDEESPPFG